MENKTILVRENIIHNLNLIPDEKLQEVDSYLKFILLITDYEPAITNYQITSNQPKF